MSDQIKERNKRMCPDLPFELSENPWRGMSDMPEELWGTKEGEIWLDMMNRPSKALDKQVDGDHYKSYMIQPIEYAQKNNLNACEFNVVKYITRHRDKAGLKDLKKAIHSIELLIEMEYSNDI